MAAPAGDPATAPPAAARPHLQQYSPPSVQLSEPVNPVGQRIEPRASRLSGRRRRWIIVAVVVVLLIGGGTTYLILRPSTTPAGVTTVADYTSHPVPGLKIRAADVLDNSRVEARIGSIFAVTDKAIVLSVGGINQTTNQAKAVIAAVDLTNGHTLWAEDAADLSPDSTSVPTSECHVASDGVLLCAVPSSNSGHQSSKVTRLNLDSGAVLSSFDVDGWRGDWIDDDLIMADRASGGEYTVSRIDGTTGQSAWSAKVQADGDDSSPERMVGNELLFYDTKAVGSTYTAKTSVVDPATGKAKHTFDTVVTGLGDTWYGVADTVSHTGIARYTLAGEQLWHKNSMSQVYGQDYNEPGVVFAADNGGALVALDSNTGDEKWSFDGGGTSTQISATVGDKIFTTSYQGGNSLYAVISLATGKQLTSSVSSYIGSSGDTIYAQDLAAAYVGAFDTSFNRIWRLGFDDIDRSYDPKTYGAVSAWSGQLIFSTQDTVVMLNPS